jgi:hypothetical protein
MVVSAGNQAAAAPASCCACLGRFDFIDAHLSLVARRCR